MRIHRIYCKSVSKPDKRFTLNDSESNHLIRALRLKENSQVEVFDGSGNSCLCKIAKYSSKLCELEKIGDLKSAQRPKKLLSAVVPFIKRTNFNFMIQKLTEIGVNDLLIYKADLIDQSIAKKDFEKIKAKVNGVDETIGIKTQAQVVKNRMGPPLRKAEFEIYFDSGIDNFGGWLKVMKAQKLVSAGGAWYTYTDDDGKVI